MEISIQTPVIRTYAVHERTVRPQLVDGVLQAVDFLGFFGIGLFVERATGITKHTFVTNDFSYSSVLYFQT